MNKAPDKLSNLGKMSVSPEELRLLAYGWFALNLIVGLALTKLFADLPERTVVFDIFAYDNVCIFFDYPPATYVLPSMWVIFLIPYGLYLVTWWLRARNCHRQGKLPSLPFRVITCLTIFELLSAVYFSQIFANRPYELKGGVLHEHSTMDEKLVAVRMHMTPFTIFIVSLFTLSLRNAYYFTNFEELKSWECKVMWLFTAVLFLVTVQKVLTQAHASSGSPLWKSNARGAMKMGRIMDPVWTLMATVIPMVATWAVELQVGDRVQIVVGHIQCDSRVPWRPFTREPTRCTLFVDNLHRPVHSNPAQDVVPSHETV